jgi:hypothetical protein
VLIERDTTVNSKPAIPARVALSYVFLESLSYLIPPLEIAKFVDKP